MGFDAREIAERTALFVAERVVDPADVRIAVHGDDLAGELRCFVAQQFEKVAVATMAKALVEMRETWVGLE